MSFIYVSPNTTWCPDTPENWRRFHELKRSITRGDADPKADLQRALQQQTARENKRLRSMRAFLPGHEPDL